MKATSSSPQSPAQIRLRNLVPGGKPHRREMRRLKVDYLPPDAQDLIAQGLSRGDSLKKISAAVKALGHQVGERAIASYWRVVWREEHDRIRRARFVLEMLKPALRLQPDSESSKVAEEILFTLLCGGKLSEMERWKSGRLLHEAREQKKLNPHKGKSSQATPSRSPAEQAREVRRRWRQLYGLDSGDKENEEN